LQIAPSGAWSSSITSELRIFVSADEPSFFGAVALPTSSVTSSRAQRVHLDSPSAAVGTTQPILAALVDRAQSIPQLDFKKYLFVFCNRGRTVNNDQQKIN
jgi:hypothetical protein